MLNRCSSQQLSPTMCRQRSKDTDSMCQEGRSPVTEPDDGLDLARQIANSYRGNGPLRPASSRRRTRPVQPARGKNEDPSTIGDLLGPVGRNQGWADKLDAQ